MGHISIPVGERWYVLADDVEKPSVAIIRVRGADKVRPIEAGKASTQAADHAARFLEDEHTGSVIPRLETDFIVEFASANGQIAQFHRGSPESSNVVALVEGFQNDA